MAYTFRTFPKINLLKKYFPNIYVFGRLKEEIESFCEEIGKNNPDFIIGIAKSNSNSVIEPIAINNIHHHKIIQDSPETLSLYAPTNPLFPTSCQPTNSFCNYSMYKIQYFLNQNKLSTKLLFVHINLKDIPNLSKIIG